MKKSHVSVIAYLTILLMSDCSDLNDLIAINNESNNQLNGTWILCERGYSPGAGYIIESIPLIPAQTVTFHETNTLSSNIQGFSDVHFFRLETDSVTDSEILYLYDEIPASGSNPVSSYFVTSKSNELKLSFRYCIEGCHLGFRKIEGTKH
jgi:hypothetical protein